MNFWITSMGRTATAWLAAQLQVQHEPKVVPTPCRMVSPKHLWMFNVEGWRPPADTAIYVMVRDAHDQLLSVVNRSLAFHKDPEGRTRQFMRFVPDYLRILGGFVADGAKVISYSRITTDYELLSRLARDLGCELADRFCDRVNGFPTRTVALTPPQEKLAATMQRHYDRWLNRHGM